MRDFYEKCRNERQLTDKQVCEQTGIKQSTLSDWLRGESQTLGADKAIALAKFFDVPLDSFVRPIETKEE
ncbi:MAG: helix-turn-helix transcriptional regulator [Oribacterium sp.]|nr:helix-turn-helix transcriptional regulator [Oribacterium sp.]